MLRRPRGIIMNNKDPEYNEYDDDDYNFYPEKNPQQPFKFDWSLWEKWFADALNDVIQDTDPNTWQVSFGNAQSTPPPVPDNPVDDSPDDIELELLYFGENQYKEGIWKTKYFIGNHFDQFYKNHFMAHAAHIVKQPHYYRGLHDMQN